MILYWSVDTFANNYFIIISSTIIASGSEIIIVTPNTTLQLPFIHNEEYAISVVANNCAGNSTPANITVVYSKFWN